MSNTCLIDTRLIIWQLCPTAHQSNHMYSISFCFMASTSCSSPNHHFDQSHPSWTDICSSKGGWGVGRLDVVECVTPAEWRSRCEKLEPSPLMHQHTITCTNTHTGALNVVRPCDVFELAGDQNPCSFTQSCIWPYRYAPLSKWILMMIIENYLISLGCCSYENYILNSD